MSHAAIARAIVFAVGIAAIAVLVAARKPHDSACIRIGGAIAVAGRC